MSKAGEARTMPALECTGDSKMPATCECDLAATFHEAGKCPNPPVARYWRGKALWLCGSCDCGESRLDDEED